MNSPVPHSCTGMRRAKVSIDEIRYATKIAIPDNDVSPCSEDNLACHKVTTELT